MMKFFRVLLAVVAYIDYEIWQMDVKIAFLNGNHIEHVYIIQFEHFVYKTKP